MAIITNVKMVAAVANPIKKAMIRSRFIKFFLISSMASSVEI